MRVSTDVLVVDAVLVTVDIRLLHLTLRDLLAQVHHDVPQPLSTDESIPILETIFVLCQEL